MAIFAAILAIGNPVALEARADDRETRGFISMTMIRPSTRVDRELDVAAAGVDADLADDGDADVAQPLVLAVGQRQRGSDGDGVAGVHAHRVEVLDGADDDDVVGVVAHDLELVLLPAEDRLLEEHLGRRGVLQALAADAAQVGLVVGEARPEATHGEGRPDDDGVAEVARPRRAARPSVWQMIERADSAPQRSTTPLNFSRSSPSLIASTLAPMSGQPYFSRTPLLVQARSRS